MQKTIVNPANLIIGDNANDIENLLGIATSTIFMEDSEEEDEDDEDFDEDEDDEDFDDEDEDFDDEDEDEDEEDEE